MRRKNLVHFSHRHPLHETDVKENDEVTVICSCCELGVTGPGFKCKYAECGFLMHKSCTELPQHITHNSHPAHALTLVHSGNFICSACSGPGAGFLYYCSVCDYGFHVKCSCLPETVKREEHEHPLSLHYSMVYDNDDVEFVCDVCDRVLETGLWVYYCGDCDFGTHLDCSIVESIEAFIKTNQKEDEKEEKVQGSSNAVASSYALMEAQIRGQQQIQRMQLQLESSRQQAQFMINMGRSMANLMG